MRILCLLVPVSTLMVCGCTRDIPPPLDPESVRPANTIDVLFPEHGPNFQIFDFGLAEIDSEDEYKVLYCRSVFQPREVSKQQTYQQIRTALVSQEVTDESGRKQTIVEQIQVPEERTREFTVTVYDLVDDQILSCPLNSLTAFDYKGKQLDAQEIRRALRSGCRVILHGTDSPEDPYYGSFLNPDTLFIHSDLWTDESLAPTPAPEISVAPIPLYLALAFDS